MAAVLNKNPGYKFLSADQQKYVDVAIKYNEYMKQKYIRPFANAMYVSEDSMRKSILEGELYDFILCDVTTKEEFKETYSE